MKSRLLLFSLVSTLPLTAADYQWDVNGATTGLGGTGAWDTTSLFWDATATGANDGTDVTTAYTFTNADTAVFGGTAGTVTLGTGVTVNGLSIDAAGYVITGNTLTLAGTTPTITANANASISSALAGSAGLIKAGTGSLTISGANSFTGGTTVNAGTLTLSRSAGFGGASGSISTGALTVNTGATATTAVVFGISGDTSGTNARVVNVNGTLNLSGSEYIRTYNLTGGTINAPTAAGDFLRTSAAGLVINSLASATTSTINNKIDLTFASATIDTADGAATNDLSITGVISENSGAGSGAKTITKTGAGTTLLSGTSTYTGGTTVSAGILDLGGTGGAGSGKIRGTVNVAAGAQLRLSTGDATGYFTDASRLSTINLNGATNFSSTGTLHVNTTSNQTLGSAVINMTGASITGITNSNLDVFAGASAINSIASATTSTISGTKLNLRQNNGLTLTVADGAAANDLTISSVISNAAGFTNNNLTKAGAGTLLLSGGNTYSTNTNVNAGTVKVGNITAFGAVNTAVTKVVVASGAAVDFNGQIDATYGYTISGTGVGSTGALTNSGGAIGTGTKQATNIRLGANASIGGSGAWALLAAGYGATSLDLNAQTLTKVGANTVSLVNTTTTAGTIQVSGGTLALGVSGTVNGSASAFTLDNTAGANLSIGVNSSVGSLAGGGTTGGNTSIGSGATLTVGALNTDTTYGGVISGAGALTKTGSGILTLSGANTYTGTTAVNAGTLRLSGSATLPSSAINVAGEALFDVSGLSSGNFTVASGSSISAGRTTDFAEDVNGNLTVDAGTLRVAGTGTTAGTLTQTGNLTLNNALLNVDLAATNTIGNGVNDFINISGDLTLTGTSDITVNKLTPALASGTYTLATCSGTLTGDAATNLTLVGLPDTARQSFALATTSNSIQLVVSGVAANLVWAGNHPTTPTVWDIGTTINWTGADGKFADGDLVLFDDTASSTDVTLDEFVEPGSVTFNNSTAKPYTLTGAGSIEGVTGLEKNGNGIVTIATDNDFSGAVSINSGAISIDTVTASGTFGRLGTGNLVNLGGASDTGTLVYTGGTTSFNRAITVGAGGGVLQLDTAASLFTQSGTVTLNGTLAKSGPGDLMISAPVSGTGGITVNAGTVILSAANTFTGTSTINAGTLQIGNAGTTGSLSSAAIVNNANLVYNLSTNGTASLPSGSLTGSGNLSASAGVIKLNGNITQGGALSFTQVGTASLYKGLELVAASTTLSASSITLSGDVGKLGSDGNSLALDTSASNGTINLDISLGRSGIWYIPTAFSANAGTGTINITGSGLDDTGWRSTPVTLTGAVNMTGSVNSNAAVTINATANGTVSGAFSGGMSLTKTGDGTLLVTGINTFSGDTTVNGGTLELASGGALRFVVNNTTSNKISGSAAVTLNGAFDIETGAVTNTTGTWTLVDAATLTENFGTFTINGAGWTETADVWTRIDGLKLWTFTEATGVLTLAPGNTFSSWMAGFTFEPGADTTPTGDADGDGISNLIENVFGTAPNAATTGLNQVSSSTPGTLIFEHPVNTSLASNVTYTYSWSTDLSEWKASGESNTGGTSVSIGAVTTGAEATVTATVTPSAAEKVFVRIQASVAP